VKEIDCIDMVHRLGLVLAVAAAAVGTDACHRETPRRSPLHPGFSDAAFNRQHLLEGQFRSSISRKHLAEFHAALTARPHLAGTPASLAQADYLGRTLQSFGLDVQAFDYDAYLSSPVEIAVEVVAPFHQPLRVTEPPADVDPDTNNRDLGPGYVAYSASGDVTAPVIYVNYGLPPDYAALAAAHVDVRGKVVIARYGRSHRAVKLHTAEAAGARALIIYSDPADDGFARGETWPSGYWRTADQLQRGNGKYSWFWHGDPLTPGQAALAAAARLDPATAPTLPRIPAVVLSWGQARTILERLGGAAAPSAFQGGLPFTYRPGDGSVHVHVRVKMDAGARPIRDIVARVPGARIADRQVLLAGHHDAWTFGGVDPGSGAASLLELARTLGALRRAGWQPQRTIALAFWDAEEPGLIGSTEYAEQHERELRDGTVCYVNTDLYMNGPLDAGGVPSLRDLVVDATKDIAEGSGSAYSRWRAHEWTRQPAERRRRGTGDFEVELKSLGSGADFVPFQDYLGLPALSIEFNATGGYTYGTYHSNYDTRLFMQRVADPGFERGAELAQLLGTIALRLGEAAVLPFRFSHYAQRLRGFVDAAAEWAVSDEGERLVPLDLTPIRAAVGRVASGATDLEARLDEGVASGALTATSAAALNDILSRLEQKLLDETDPPERRWYRHVIYGWNIYSLYDGQPFPGLADAIRSRDAARVGAEVGRIVAALDRLAGGLAEARRVADNARRR
jgi:N-acetylated-alpha-linked acidic dipeptidase